jgi:glyoxylase-like metal-dependent hydrolase (beta-lactamase superfamily II)
MSRDTALPDHLTVFERGWLSSNNVLLHGHGEGAVLVDTGYVLHAEQTVALVRQALRDEALACIVNTHLHSDHCGGNAAVQRAFGCPISIPPGHWHAVCDWDEEALSYAPTGQRCERFVPDERLMPGDVMRVGRQRWDAFAAPGHDPHSLILFNAADGVLISADALWERGFGIVFPALGHACSGDAFDDVARALDLIESLDARWAIPGHGAPFSDIAGSLAQARQRLAAFRASPQRHARHAVRALLKYHLLEVQEEPWEALMAWFTGVSLYPALWRQLGEPAGSMHAFAEEIVADMARSGVLAVRNGRVCNT